MKRFFSLILVFLSISFFVTAQDFSGEEDDFDEVYVYEANGAGDQFLKINLGALFPLNFKKQLKTGGIATIGYYRFITGNIALGGELSATYNISIGDKTLVMIPMTFCVMYQPYVGNFEFPLYAGIGVSNETWQNSEIFPTLVTKLSAGAFYRISDSISLGLSTDFFWIPQWFKNPEKTFNGLFETAVIGLRYHF